MTPEQIDADRYKRAWCGVREKNGRVCFRVVFHSSAPWPVSRCDWVRRLTCTVLTANELRYTLNALDDRELYGNWRRSYALSPSDVEVLSVLLNEGSVAKAVVELCNRRHCAAWSYTTRPTE